MLIASLINGGSSPVIADGSSLKPSPKGQDRNFLMHMFAQGGGEFAGEWGAFIRDQFPSAEAVQRAFGVSRRTAIYWENGERAPRGVHVAIAVVRFGFLKDDAK